MLQINFLPPDFRVRNHLTNLKLCPLTGFTQRFNYPADERGYFFWFLKLRPVICVWTSIRLPWCNCWTPSANVQSGALSESLTILLPCPVRTLTLNQFLHFLAFAFLRFPRGHTIGNYCPYKWNSEWTSRNGSRKKCLLWSQIYSYSSRLQRICTCACDRNSEPTAFVSVAQTVGNSRGSRLPCGSCYS
jgi:hypothetical protein